MFVRVRHHGLLRLASALPVSVACVGEFDFFPAGVPNRQALLECVARPRVVGLYEGPFWARLARPGSSLSMAESAAVGVTSIARPSGGRR